MSYVRIIKVDSREYVFTDERNNRVGHAIHYNNRKGWRLRLLYIKRDWDDAPPRSQYVRSLGQCIRKVQKYIIYRDNKHYSRRFYNRRSPYVYWPHPLYWWTETEEWKKESKRREMMRRRSNDG